ncbi:unnamed protein product [Microthlaspi erraticum]|uniref:DUF577 domain-containing protein n=1 Tax=Microthlaspi erraticum TaxID=1685480 RepID=A0A6D2KRB6_9BRAS|nr:unnamed protein product [Microthlaspi erraticum]
MTESSNLMLKARDLLATPSHEGLSILVDQLFVINGNDTEEHKPARALYDFCVKHFANCLTKKLLMVYQDSSSDEVFRLRSITLLSKTLKELRDRRSGFEFSHVALQEIKPLVISCLATQENTRSRAKILGKIVSFVAYNVLTLQNGSWDELSECIQSLADTEPLKSFYVFLGLPPIKNLEFINRFMERVLEEAKKVLLVPEEEEDWCLGLKTIVKMGIQVLNSENYSQNYLIKSILYTLVKSANELVEKKKKKKMMRQFLQLQLEGLEKFLSRENNLFKYDYNEDQRRFLSELSLQMRKLSFDFFPLDHGVRFRLQGFKYLKTLSSLEILEMVVSNKLGVLEEELAMGQLNVLLSRHSFKEKLIDVAMIRKLQPLIITCLGKQETPENTFKILGEVVHHVAKEIFEVQDDTWNELRDYITSHCEETEFFNRGCYIFRCLNTPLDDQDFVVPVMEKLLPVIRRMLNPPRNLLVDNFGWVLAFTGAFCAIIQMVEVESHAGSVEEIEEKMIEVVGNLVERRMEIGIVMRAFRDLETIVEEQLKWYTTNEFALVKRLLRKLLEIEGMRIESKVVLKRINEIVERNMAFASLTNFEA